MFSLLVEWAISHLALTIISGVLALLGITAGVRAVRKAKKRRSAAYVKDIDTHFLNKNTVAKRRRANRRKQDLGLVVRKRADDDPRLVRKMVRKIKTSRTNKRAEQTVNRPPKELITTRIADKASAVTGGRPRTGKVAFEFQQLCNAKNDTDKNGCRNPQTPPGSGACWIPSHQAQVRSGKQT